VNLGKARGSEDCGKNKESKALNFSHQRKHTDALVQTRGEVGVRKQSKGVRSIQHECARVDYKSEGSNRADEP
jgi:hypothetical protein